MIVFVYKRDDERSFSWRMTMAALMVASGQIYYVIRFLHGNLDCSWPQALMQIGLSIAFYTSRGSVNRAAKKIITHSVSKKQTEITNKKAA